MSNSVTSALANLFSRHIQANGEQGQGITDYDPDWQSPCQLAKRDETTIFWQPVDRAQDFDLKNIEQALDLTIHPDITAFYCRFFAPTLAVKWQQDDISLIQVWNQEDFEILQENLLGHLMMKQKLKQKLTVFIATTANDEYFISLLNATGEIFLERVGCEPKQKLADSLAEFIEQVSVQ